MKISAKSKNYIIVFSISMLVFLLSCFGIFDGISEIVATKLYNTFGYTNEWTKSYGPEWFAESIRNIVALTSKELIFIFTLFFFFYLRIVKRTSASNNLIFIMGAGFVLLIVSKLLSSKHHAITFESLVLQNISYFPSGHAYLATIFYLSVAHIFKTGNEHQSLDKYLTFASVVIILLVGACLFMGSGHSVTEVIAGWSLGVCWFTFSQLFFRADYKKLTNK